MSATERGYADETLSYYDEHAQEFSDSTVGISFDHMYAPFEDRLAPGASILDLGCGSGRDSLHFIGRGYQVTSTDGSRELCLRASELLGREVRCELFGDLADIDAYDGIWACSSILHVPKARLADVMGRMRRALHPHGIIYTSFKEGDFEGMRHGRYFTNFTEASLRRFLEGVGGLEIDTLWHTFDARPERGSETWLNVLLTRS
jgi:SAM-dependent methyltransferase